jgi:hypothetical protein
MSELYIDFLAKVQHRVHISLPSKYKIPHGFGRTRSTIKDTSRTPPPNDSFKVNVDGAFQPLSRNSTCGFIVCDHKGNFVAGFYGKIGVRNMLLAKALALLDEVRTNSNLNIKKVLFERDSKLFVDMINDTGPPTSVLRGPITTSSF